MTVFIRVITIFFSVIITNCGIFEPAFCMQQRGNSSSQSNLRSSTIRNRVPSSISSIPIGESLEENTDIKSFVKALLAKQRNLPVSFIPDADVSKIMDIIDNSGVNLTKILGTIGGEIILVSLIFYFAAWCLYLSVSDQSSLDLFPRFLAAAFGSGLLVIAFGIATDINKHRLSLIEYFGINDALNALP